MRAIEIVHSDRGEVGGEILDENGARGTIINSSWYLQHNALVLQPRTFTVADRTRFFRNLAPAITLRANHCLLNVTENRPGNINYLAGAAALVADFQFIARLNCRPLTVLLALLLCVDVCVGGTTVPYTPPHTAEERQEVILSVCQEPSRA